MLIDHWPLFGLRVRTARLELRLPDSEELAELGEVAARGVHDPAVMPFSVPWTDLPPAERARSVIQFGWRCQAEWTPARWALPLAVLRDGAAVGIQEIAGTDFALLREVRTGSWLGREFQGQGLGAEMRAAVLHLAFAGLGAEQARTEAFSDNPASNAVSRKLGYVPDGITRHVVRGRPVESHRLRLTRDHWSAAARTDCAIEGLAPCLPLFGLTASCDA